MYKNYWVTAWRNFRRNKVFSFINIIGLSIGISASLVIYLLVAYDLSFDKSHEDSARIYRVVTDMTFSGEPFKASGVPGPMPKAVRAEVAGLDLVVPFRLGDQTKMTIPGSGKSDPLILKKQDHIVFVNEDYFKLIRYDWLAGSPQTSLNEPYQTVLTESNAHLLFPHLGTQEILGKRILLNDTISTVVSGIVKDLAYNTDFTFLTFISRLTLEKTSLKPEDWDQWGNVNSVSQVFVKLSAKTNQRQTEAALNALYKKHNPPDPKDHSTTDFRLQPLADLHFNADYRNFFGGDHLAHKPTLYGLLAVAAFLLLLACINFINLTTAQSSQRAKEIGIRKTIGSSRRQLLIQFLSETFLLTLMAALLSVLITPLLLKIFDSFIPKGLHFSLARQPGVLPFLLGLVIVVSLLSGVYPALVLASYKPVLVLKNQLISGNGENRRTWLRKSLTVAQFVIAQIFIIATILVAKQIHYSLHKDLGFKKEAIVYFKTNFYDPNQGKRFILINKLKSIPGIAMVSLSSDPPSISSAWSSGMTYKDGKKEVSTQVQVKLADTNYLNLFGLKLLAGTNLPQADTVKNLLINETYAHLLGFTDPRQAIGKTIRWDDKNDMIAGVVADFHQGSLHEKIKPLLIATSTSQERNINIALQAQNGGSEGWKPTLAKMQAAWREIYPEDDLNYEFQDETIAKYYKSEQDISQLLNWATGLAIFISCLGLLGLVIYITNQRTKEIGIRKIVGASVLQLIALLSADFLKLIGLAFLIAVPIAWWSANKWLDNFAYRTDLSWWVFFGAGSAMLLIAFVILLLRTFRAATISPVKSLRTE